MASPRKKSKKKTKKSAPAPRRTPWHQALQDTIMAQVLVPTLRRFVTTHEAAAASTSAAQLHAYFEDNHSCSIPREVFNLMCVSAGIAFSKGISLLTPRPFPPVRTSGQIAPAPNDPINDHPDTSSASPQPEGDDDVRFENEDPSAPAASPAVVLEQARLHDAMNDANGLPPEPIIIPANR